MIREGKQGEKLEEKLRCKDELEKTRKSSVLVLTSGSPKAPIFILFLESLWMKFDFEKLNRMSFVDGSELQR